MDWSNDTCPITNEPVREALPRMGDYAEFICPTCGRFRISGTSMETIRTYDPNRRLEFLEQARVSAAGGIPFIKGVP